jgi:hypothetical protein
LNAKFISRICDEVYLKFAAPVGDDLIKVEVGIPSGMDSQAYSVTIDNYCYGSIIKRNGNWVQLDINSRELTVYDVQALGELADEN